MTLKNRNQFFLPAILFAALVVRALYWKGSLQSPFYEPLLLDAQYYDQWARKIAAGNFGNTVFYGLPLYPFMLGCIYKISGGSFVVAKWIQICLGVLTVLFVYRTGKALADHRTGLYSAGLAAFFGPLFFHEALLIPEAIGISLYAAAFLSALQFLKKRDAAHAIRLGVLCGLAALTKAGLLLFAVFFAFYLLIKKVSPRMIALFLISMGCVLAPVTAHNVIRGKDLVFLTSHSGFNFYVGNNEKAEGAFDPPDGVGGNVESQAMDSRAIAERELGRTLKPSEVSRYWSDKAWRFIRSNPTKVLELCGRKLVLFFDSRELSDVDDYIFGKKFNPVLNWPWIDFGAVVILLFAGSPVAVRSRHRDLIFLWIGSYLVGMMAFFVNARYRLPMMPLFLTLAGMAIVAAQDIWKRSDRKNLAILFVAALAGFGISRVHLVGTDESRNYVNAGDAYSLTKRYREADGMYRAAIQINPSNPKAHLAIGLNFARSGRSDEAKEYYQKTLELDPGNYQAHNNLGLLFDQAGDLTTAREHFLAALTTNPNSFQAHNNLGMLYGKTGDMEAASREFEESIRLNPAGARAYTNLGLVRYQMRDKEGARRNWERALEIDPDFKEARKALSLLNQVVSA